MKVTFYGTRGSTPVSDRDYLEVGGNTSCVLVTFDMGKRLILDAGTGLRKLGSDLVGRLWRQDRIYLLLSHTHWDHIQGFPFFRPAYDPKKHVVICICGKGRGASKLENIMGVQMQRDYFPVSLDRMGAISFWEPDITDYTTDSGLHIVASPHNHPGGAFSYRLEEKGKSMVYCTDVEYTNGIDPNVVALSRHADLLIHDAQYTREELKEKNGWGHSSWEEAIEVAEQAQVKRLVLFHHDPDHNDAFLFEIEKDAQKRFPGAFLAREGMEVEL